MVSLNYTAFSMMKNSDNISPILNNPYEEPKWHYDATLEGNLDYSKVLEGRRPYSAHLTVMPDASSSKALFSAGDIPVEDENANFINGIRQVVKEWRKQGYPKVTRTSRDLLAYWFLNLERELNKSLFFCQREAVETAIYLNEVAPRDPNLGRSILHEFGKPYPTSMRIFCRVPHLRWRQVREKRW